MNSLQAAAAKFRTAVLGHLSPAEKQAVEAAVVTLRNGWPGHDNIKGMHQFEVFAKDTNAFVTELSSNDPKRQRRALADPKLQARLVAEDSRNRWINNLYYFKELGKGTFFTLRTAIEARNRDSYTFLNHTICEDTPEGEAIRAKHFPNITDNIIRGIIGHLVFLCFNGLTISDDTLTDQQVVNSLEENFQWLASGVPEEDLGIVLNACEQAARLTEPKRIIHYFSFLRDDGWQERLIEGQRSKREVRAAEASKRDRLAKAEAERVAAEKRKQIEPQLAFSVKDEILDISMYGWPRLVDAADKVTLFENLRSAFARATKLKFAYLPDFGTGLLVERSIRSMSVRQLACVKNLIWADRVGLQFEFKELGDLSASCAQDMLELLNADGHAYIETRTSRLVDFKPLFPELAAKWRADVDDVWFQHADTFQKWIESDTFAGELTRWIVEDPGDSAGWATSR